MKKNTGLVFVYGTLKVGGYYAGRFDNFRLNSIPASVNGRLYTPHGGWPCMIPGDEGVVIGELHKYKDFEEVLQALNYIEGYREETDSGLFIRREVEVFLKNGSKVKALTYIWPKDPEGLFQIEEGLWDVDKAAAGGYTKDVSQHKKEKEASA
jgi:gamma-glutamylcyclotransferase (GGCT)/AIG2-like uncharacterized protein YtfP